VNTHCGPSLSALGVSIKNVLQLVVGRAERMSQLETENHRLAEGRFREDLYYRLVRSTFGCQRFANGWGTNRVYLASRPHASSEALQLARAQASNLSKSAKFARDQPAYAL
jgi:hypothetical protein